MGLKNVTLFWYVIFMFCTHPPPHTCVQVCGPTVTIVSLTLGQVESSCLDEGGFQYYCPINYNYTLIRSSYSDGTLNPAGVRFGSAEIYNISECNFF